MFLAVTETEKCGFKEESIFSRVGNFTFVKKVQIIENTVNKSFMLEWMCSVYLMVLMQNTLMDIYAPV